MACESNSTSRPPAGCILSLLACWNRLSFAVIRVVKSFSPLSLAISSCGVAIYLLPFPLGLPLVLGLAAACFLVAATWASDCSSDWNRP